jgi:type I phosphodiesterase/nucleotide pyrophosphatase
MKKGLSLVLLIASVAGIVLRGQEVREPEIRLVLLIAVDQFRYDYLTRFRADYSGGLRRLLTDGAVFTNANLEHYPTVTAVGHATMLTGATPSESGIIGNDWFDRETGTTVTSVSDSTVTVVGSPTGSAASPRRLLVSTVGDELKLASRAAKGAAEAPRVFSISLKDRSAILPGGRSADAAYWWDTKSGRFVTSSYYTAALSPWVQTYNDLKRADRYAGRTWAPLATPALSLRTLPADVGAPLYDAVYGSPFGNDELLAFATELLQKEALGTRHVTDLLSVSFSSNDSVGHTYGPDSPQVRDIAIRTDATIGELLRTVDRLVGLSHVLVAFTTDHGVAPVPETLTARGLPGGRITTKDLFDPLQRALTTQFGEGKWLLATAGSAPYLNYELIDSLKLDAAAVRRVAATAMTQLPHVARVYTRDQLLRGEVANDRIGSRVLRGFNARRSGDLEIILEPYWMRQAQGTTHGTPYNYDAHIPIILMGPRIRAGEYAEAVALNDLAPTLATLVGVEIPSASVGRVLTEALRPKTTDVPAERSKGAVRR